LDVRRFHNRDKAIEIPPQCEDLNGLSLEGLRFVTVSEGNMRFTFKDDVLIRKKTNELIRYFGVAERVLVKSSIEIIGVGCFSGCSYIREVMFESESRLKEIGYRAFAETKIRSIRILNTVEKIGRCCFSWCFCLCEVMLGLCRLLYMENMARKMRVVNKAVRSLRWKTKQNNSHQIVVLSSPLPHIIYMANQRRRIIPQTLE
jgi:hypothetical protein